MNDEAFRNPSLRMQGTEPKDNMTSQKQRIDPLDPYLCGSPHEAQDRSGALRVPAAFFGQQRDAHILARRPRHALRQRPRYFLWANGRICQTTVVPEFPNSKKERRGYS
jgi:hypothetical protein